MGSKQDNTNLYRVLERGDRLIQKAHETAIILAGLTRAGKSTTFNWILGKNMIGVGDEVEAHYENQVNDASTAQLGDTFTSVTLCPNVMEFDRENKISLMDMAGYKDKRDYIGVLGVSYFLKAVFQRVKQVKFLIVIDQQKLKETSGDGVINTFTGFLNMFNLKDMPLKTSEGEMSEERKAFYSSISLIVTRTENKTKHQAYLRRISSQIKDKKLNVDNKDQVILLIDDIIDKNRIEPFSIAIANQNPPKCDFIDRFDNDLKWKYLNIADIEKKMKAELISLPFLREFQELKQDQKQSFKYCIKAKVDSFNNFAKIINTLIHSIKQSWNYAIQDWANTSQLSLSINRCQPLFEKVREFLEENDFYNSEDKVAPEIRAEFKKLNFVACIRKVLEVYKITDQIGLQADNKFLGNMVIYSGLFENLVLCLIPFAQSAEEEHLLLRLCYVIKRGFREFSKLYQLNPDDIHQVNQKMKDNCNDVFEEKREEFIQLFVTKISPELLITLYTKIDELIEYQGFFNEYEREYNARQEPIFFYQHHYGIQMAKAKLYLQDCLKKKAVKCYVSAYKYLCKIAFSTSRSYKLQEEIQADLNSIHMKKLAIIGSINALLKTFKEIPEVFDFALTLSKHVKDIHESCQIYQLVIGAAKPHQKTGLLDEFAEYCLEWGRMEQANTILQKKLSLERSDFLAYMATIKKLTTIAQDKSRYNQKYTENLSSWSRLDEDDPVINDYLDQLELTIHDE